MTRNNITNAQTAELRRRYNMNIDTMAQRIRRDVSTQLAAMRQPRKNAAVAALAKTAPQFPEVGDIPPASD